MNKYLFLSTIFFLVGCGPMQTKMVKYVEVTNGPLADIKARGALQGSGLTKTHLEIFSGCFEGRDYSKENVLGKVYFKREEFGKKTISIPAGKRLYFKYGTNNPTWLCHSQFSFVPQEGSAYLFDYKMVYAGCKVNVTNLTTNEPIDMRVYEKTTEESVFVGTALAWRKCTNLDVEN